MSLSIRIDAFEGPLDLLLHLIDEAEVDIYDVSISEITDQYVDYLQSMQELELEIASEFLLMAATLISIKSRKLLPKPIELYEFDDFEYEERDPQLELIQQLIEYKRYKKMAEVLKERENLRGLHLSKPPSSFEPFIKGDWQIQVELTSIFDLIKSYIISKSRQAQEDVVATVAKDAVTVEEKIDHIRSLFTQRDKAKFSELLMSASIEELVVTLLAILEMMKSQEIRCIQDKLFEDFIIYKAKAKH